MGGNAHLLPLSRIVPYSVVWHLVDRVLAALNVMYKEAAAEQFELAARNGERVKHREMWKRRTPLL